MGFAGLMGDGGMADFAVVPAYMLHRLPDGMSLEQAAVMEPAAVALHALRRGELRLGETCAVFGLGPIGLLLIMLAKLQGATTIVAVDVSPERLAAARALRRNAYVRRTRTRCIRAAGRDPRGHGRARRRCEFRSGRTAGHVRIGDAGTAQGRPRRDGRPDAACRLRRVSRGQRRADLHGERRLPACVRRPAAHRRVGRALDLTSIVTRTVSLEDAVSDGFDALLADRAQIKILVSPAQRPARRAHTIGSVEHESSVGV